jgi:hypothetical protein
MSGRYPRGERQAALREHSLILDAREMVKGGVIRGDRRHGGSLESILTGDFAKPHYRTASGRYLVHCDDTLPLRWQNEVRHRMRLSTMWLDFTHRGGVQVTQEIGLLAALTRVEVVFWGFACPQCHRYSRKLFLPKGRRAFLCRRCHRLRYISQDKLNRWAREHDPEWDTDARRMGFPSARMYRKIQTAGLGSIGLVRP